MLYNSTPSYSVPTTIYVATEVLIRGVEMEMCKKKICPALTSQKTMKDCEVFNDMGLYIGVHSDSHEFC